MKIKVSDERKGNVNYANANILECVKFWNREGEDTYQRNKTQFLAYKDDNDSLVSGYFEVINLDHPIYIEFISKGNIVRIPWHRVLKNKEKEKENVST